MRFSMRSDFMGKCLTLSISKRKLVATTHCAPSVCVLGDSLPVATILKPRNVLQCPVFSPDSNPPLVIVSHILCVSQVWVLSLPFPLEPPPSPSPFLSLSLPPSLHPHSLSECFPRFLIDLLASSSRSP